MRDKTRAKVRKRHPLNLSDSEPETNAPASDVPAVDKPEPAAQEPATPEPETSAAGAADPEAEALAQRTRRVVTPSRRSQQRLGLRPAVDGPAPRAADQGDVAISHTAPRPESEPETETASPSSGKPAPDAPHAAETRARFGTRAGPAPAMVPMDESAGTPPATAQTRAVSAGTTAGAPVAPTSPRKPPARSAYLIASLACALWVGGIAAWFAFEYGSGFFDLDPLRLALMALVTLAPVGLLFALARSIRQGAALAFETARARDLAEALVAPTALAARDAAGIVQGLREDIDLAHLTLEKARTDLTALRESLSSESARLGEAAETALKSSQRLGEQLSAEHRKLSDLAALLDKSAITVLEAVEQHGRMVVDASDLAQTQLREAEAAMASRTADMAAAAVEAQEAARLAAEDLSRQTLRLENAGAGVADQIRTVEEGLGEQRAALVTAAYGLRSQQEDFAAQLESQRAQLAEALSAARHAASEMGDISESGAQALRDLVEAAVDQFQALSEMSNREADNFDSATKQSLDRFEALAAETRDALAEETAAALAALKGAADQARALSSEATEQAQARVDRLAEALFEAARQAEDAADARIKAARQIIADTAGMVDEAGEQAVARLGTHMDRLRETLASVEDTVRQIDERAERLPAEARERMEAVRASVEEGLGLLSEASRKAAEETQAVDAAFQDRVKRNYDMLSEAVRLMGVVSGDSPLAGRRRELPPLEPSLRPARHETASEMPRSEAGPETPADSRTDSRSGTRSGTRSGSQDGQADKLRDGEPARGGFGRRSADPARADTRRDLDEALGWSDLGGEPGSDGEEAPLELGQTAPPSQLTERLTDAIRRLGVDPNALLPRARVEEAAVAFQDLEGERARQIVRRVAPAAVRSLSRRVLSIDELREDAEQYVRQYAAMVRAAARSDPRGYEVLDLLASDAGRAFLLLDAAVGDLT
ncbi:MAG: tipN [Brevundimonas sp.]|uniref:tipN n=1 Tax=Brevundimonas sp. TaxID=1871086 RepID=UPI00391D9389